METTEALMKTFEVDAIIEIPYGSKYKYEADKVEGGLKVDRPLPAPIPYNYGYIPGTLHADGDPLDICVIGSNPIFPLTKVKVMLLGAFICTDNGYSDDKLVGYVVGENDLSVELCKGLVRDYLSCYKVGFVVENFVGANEAYRILMKDVDAYQNE